MSAQAQDSLTPVFAHADGVRTLVDPAQNAVAVVPADGTDLAQVSRWLVAAVAGVAVVNMQGTGNSIAIPLAAGVPMPVRCTRVLASGTTATGIISLY
jgi:hypothetical protein